MVDFNLETWMTALAPVIGERKLTELFVPGSHNSAITQDCLTSRPLLLPTEAGPDAPEAVRALESSPVIAL
jgi:hypothetical protein